MKGTPAAPRTIDEYIERFPPHVQRILEELRAKIRAAAPGATEKISYQMPTFYTNENLVHFAAYEHHIGFYPAPSAIEAFQDRLSGYKKAKGSVQFPIDNPLPLDLIEEMVRFRVDESAGKERPSSSRKSGRSADRKGAE